MFTFIFYTKYSPWASENFIFIPYTDDIKLFNTVSRSFSPLTKEHNPLINAGFLKVNDLLVANQFALNPSRTKYMLFQNTQNTQ